MPDNVLFFWTVCSRIRTELKILSLYVIIRVTEKTSFFPRTLLITLKICSIYLWKVHLMSLFLIGTLFLWVLWPSFNSGPVGDSRFQQNRAVVNTYLSLSACVATSFLASSLLHKEYKLKMVSVNTSISRSIWV